MSIKLRNLLAPTRPRLKYATSRAEELSYDATHCHISGNSVAMGIGSGVEVEPLKFASYTVLQPCPNHVFLENA